MKKTSTHRDRIRRAAWRAADDRYGDQIDAVGREVAAILAGRPAALLPASVAVRHQDAKVRLDALILARTRFAEAEYARRLVGA